MTQNTFRVSKGYLTKKESDWLLHQVTWLPKSAYVGTPSRVLEKHSRWSWLRESQECAKLSPRKSVATLKNLKSKIYFDLFNSFLVATWFHMSYFIGLMSSLLFYDVKINKYPWMSRCVQTIDWYCIFAREPSCLSKLLAHSSDTHAYLTRHATRGLFTVAKSRTDYGRHTVLHRAMTTWNSIPQQVTDTSSKIR